MPHLEPITAFASVWIKLHCTYCTSSSILSSRHSILLKPVYSTCISYKFHHTIHSPSTLFPDTQNKTALVDCFQWGCYHPSAPGAPAQSFLGAQNRPGPSRCVSPVLNWRASSSPRACPQHSPLDSPGGTSPGAGLCIPFCRASWGSSLLTSPVHPDPCKGLHNHLAHQTTPPSSVLSANFWGCALSHHPWMYTWLHCTRNPARPWITLLVIGPRWT